MSAEGLLFISRGFEPSSHNTLEPSLVIRTHLSYSKKKKLSLTYFKLLQDDSHSHNRTFLLKEQPPLLGSRQDDEYFISYIFTLPSEKSDINLSGRQKN